MENEERVRGKYERRRRTRKKEQIRRVLRRLRKMAATEEHLHQPFTTFTDFLLSISEEAIPITRQPQTCISYFLWREVRNV